MWQTIKKDWGVARQIDGRMGLWHASIKAGGKSSWHRHPRQSNLLYVLSGELRVELGNGLIVTLRSGSSWLVNVGEVHQFEALTDVELVEVYDPMLPCKNGFEIERFDENPGSNTGATELDSLVAQGAG